MPEEAPLAIQYKTHTRVSKIEEVFADIYVSGVGPTTIFRKESRGWFITLAGSYERLHVGFNPPAFRVGDEIEIIIRRKTP